MLKDFCYIPTNESDTDFVGLRFDGNKPQVFFPRGFALQDDDSDVRRDILSLFEVIRKFGDKSQGNLTSGTQGINEEQFPLMSYQHIIRDYLENGYYKETEVIHGKSTRGKINWKKTIHQIKPELDSDNVVYLRFITRKNNISTDNLISQIHQFCVRDSFEKLGWLYTSNDYLPPKPVLNFDRKLFLSVLYDQLSKTYNDAKRLLFTSMIHIVEASSDNEKLTIEASFGVETFETVWERLIDHIFGEEDRSRYFPRGEWHIVDGIDEHIVSSVLKPDTIIEYDQKYYVLDAKYYKYGITRNPQNLPPTESIQKQITYARFIEKHFAEGRKIRNAFIIPFNRGDETNDPYKFVAAGTADWEDYGLEAPDYMYVLAILADTRYLIKTYTRYNAIEIERMTSVIEEALINYRGIVIYPTAQLEEDMQF